MTTKPDIQVLTVAGVKRAARERYRAGKLTAQHPDHNQRICAYRVGYYRCSIGAALDNRTLARIEKARMNTGHTVNDLIDAGIVAVVNLAEKNKLMWIQNAHDTWARASSRGYQSEKIMFAREHFLALITPKKKARPKSSKRRKNIPGRG